MRNVVASKDEESEPTRVVIVGGGAAGVITAAQLLRNADSEHPVDVRIIERDAVMGPGLAYRTNHPLHTLNNFAARLSAVDGDPDHLLRWCADRDVPADPQSFLPREVYGRYLADVLDEVVVPPGSALRRTRGVVADLTEDGPHLTAHLSCGVTVEADTVVLALGNPPPRRQPQLEALGESYVPDPWAADLRARVGDAQEVLLVGTGLTMVDVVASLHDVAPGTRFTAVSRHGLLPHAHRRGSVRLHDVFNPGTPSLDATLASVRARIQEVEEVGGDWRDVVDSVRVCANDLWSRFSRADRERFVAEVARHWEISRHRMSPEMASHVDYLRESGTLRIERVDDVDISTFDLVVNCTGPAPAPTPGWNPLVDALLARGAIRPHHLGLGLDLDTDGRAVDTAGRAHPAIYVVGAARRGIEWEVAAIPDLRNQAARLATHVVQASATATATANVGTSSPEEVVPA